MRRLYVFPLWCIIQLFTQAVPAQVITVLDQNTLQPVTNAIVQNENQSISLSTDYHGETPIDQFQEEEQISINHSSYETHITTPLILSQSEYIIRLRQKIIVIDEIVVSANRWEQEKKQIPNRILSISPKDFALKNPQTTADILGSTGQVFIQKSQLGGGSPMIRGFAANSVLIVLDGVRMNNAIFRSGNLHNVISIDPFTLDNTEVLFGPGSVMYGSDALGGVMHLRTRSPGFVNQEKTVLQTNSLLRYSTANNEKTAHVDLTATGNRVSLFSSISFSDFNHLKMGSRRTDKFPDYGKRFEYVQRIADRDSVIRNPDVDEQIFSGYHQLNLLNKFRLRLGAQSDLTYTINYSITSDVPRYDRLIETDDDGALKAAEWYYGPQKWLSNGLQLNLYRSNPLFDGAKIIVALQHQKESRNNRDFGSDWLSRRSEKVKMFTTNLDLEKELDPHNTLFYGMEWFHNDVDSRAESRNLITGVSRPVVSRYPEGGSSFSGLAFYLSHKWQVHQKATLTSGVRYNHTWLKALIGDTISNGLADNQFISNNGAINGSVGLAWLPAPSWQINTVVSTGFRAPNIDDLGKVFDGANGVVMVPNTDLKPEYSYNFELGITKSLQNKFIVSATGFYTILDNALVQENFTYNGMDSIYFDGEYSKIQALVNSNTSKIYGGNMQLEWAITPEFGFSSFFTITRGEDSEGHPLRHTTPNFGQLGLIYQKQQFTGEIYYKFSGKRSYQDLPLSEQQKTHLYTTDGALSWQTLNISVSYYFSKSFTLNLGVENIFDQHYLPYSSGISAPGRNFIAAVKYSL